MTHESGQINEHRQQYSVNRIMYSNISVIYYIY